MVLMWKWHRLNGISLRKSVGKFILLKILLDDMIKA